MVSNDIIQAALLAKAQSIVALTAALTGGASSIKQLNFKGTDFSYPSVRLALEGQTELSEMSCPSQVDFSFYVFSEKSSSKEADQIAGIIVSAIRGISFKQNTVRFTKIRITENIPAIAQDEVTWRSQIRCQSIVNLA
jgi:hypothetical protein